MAKILPANESVLKGVHGWLGLELDFLALQPLGESPRKAETAETLQTRSHDADSDHSTPGSDNATSETTTATTVIDIEEDGGRGDVVMSNGVEAKETKKEPANSSASPTEHVFLKPAIPDRLKQTKEQQNITDLLDFDLGHVHSTLPPQLGTQFPSLGAYDLDSPIGVLETTYGLFLGHFLDEILRLYFRNIHPYYPVIDEFDFDACFSRSLQDVTLRNSRACVLGVMFLCASMYLKSKQMYGYRRWTQLSLQQHAFRAVKKLYDENKDGDQYTLTQACMLLSYWSPCYPEPRHICSDWMQKSFAHGKSAGLDQATSGAITDRSRLIWCCLIVRDRVISFSSRRPLHALSTRQKWVRVDREDFGLEICLPRYADINSRTELVDAFLMLCRLSETLVDIKEHQEKLLPNLADAEFELGRKDILRISQLDIRLREWKRGFKQWKASPHVATVLDSRGSFYLRNIVAESATASLYIPYIHLPTCKTDPLATKFAQTALQKLKTSAARVAETVRELLVELRSEEIPPFMSVWLPLPIIVLLVSIKYHDAKEVGEDITRLRHLFSVLRVFQIRYRSARFVLELITKVSRELRLWVWDVEGLRPDMLLQSGGGERAGGEEMEESELLKRAAEMLDVGIRSDITGGSDR